MRASGSAHSTRRTRTRTGSRSASSGCRPTSPRGPATAAGATWPAARPQAHPEADWIAIGLIGMPDDQSAWVAQGVGLELDEVLTTRTLPLQKPLADGYTVRRLDGDDWSLSVARLVADNARTGE